mgnify:CR=1 FL=1
MRQVGGIDSQGEYYNPQLGVHRDIALSINDGVQEGLPDADILQNIINNSRFKHELMRSYPSGYRAAFDFLRRVISDFRNGNYSYFETLERNERLPRWTSGRVGRRVTARGGKRRRMNRRSGKKSLRKRSFRKSRSRRR